MKKYILIILTCIISCHLEAQQHPNLEEIKKYYLSIDKEKLIDTLFFEYKKNSTKIDKELASIGIIFDSINKIKQEKEENKDIINIRSKNSVILIGLKFRNGENYNYNKNIYDFIYVDSSKTQIRYYNELKHYNKTKGEKTILRNDALFFTYSFGKDIKDFRKLLDYLEKEQPEVLFVPNWIITNGKNINYMFLKDDKIYIYRSRSKKIYELNKFIHKFFKEEDFKKYVIFNRKRMG